MFGFAPSLIGLRRIGRRRPSLPRFGRANRGRIFRRQEVFVVVQPRIIGKRVRRVKQRSRENAYFAASTRQFRPPVGRKIANYRDVARWYVSVRDKLVSIAGRRVYRFQLRRYPRRSFACARPLVRRSSAPISSARRTLIRRRDAALFYPRASAIFHPRYARGAATERQG